MKCRSLEEIKQNHGKNIVIGGEMRDLAVAVDQDQDLHFVHDYINQAQVAEHVIVHVTLK